MKKVAIVGAGVSGLTCGQLLSGKFPVTIFEKSSKPGGLIRCEKVEGSLFHTCGGHVFNTKSEKVLKWFWSKFDRESQFLKATRHSAICFEKEGFVDYPIENHLFQLSADVQRNVIRDLLGIVKSPMATAENFEDFLLTRFGRTLYDLYFGPYNKKIWKSGLRNVPLAWLQGKLPMPSVEEIIYANMNHVEERDFVHSTFYYGKEGGSQLIADTLAKPLDIRYQEDVTAFTRAKNRWIVNGEAFDVVIFTGSLRTLPKLVHGLDLGGYLEPISQLAYHGTTSVFCELDHNPYSWFYQPTPRHDSHRVICTGNFSSRNNANGKMTGTVEFTDEVGRDEIVSQLERMPFHPKYVAHNFSRLTYPIQGQGTRELVASLRHELAKENLFLCGRFAEWEYYNMDKAMEAAMKVAEDILALSENGLN